MSETENIILTDRLIIPNNESIFSIIGNKSILWQSIMNYMHEHYKDISEEWKFYNDGKRWLFRLIQKKKTIFWIGVLKNTFRISFWFGDKAESLIESSDLPDSIKNDFKTAKRYNKIRAVSIKMTDETDVDNVLKLAAIKLNLK
jgi:hypothetical protein